LRTWAVGWTSSDLGGEDSGDAVQITSGEVERGSSVDITNCGAVGGGAQTDVGLRDG